MDKKREIQYRYYEMPAESYVVPLLGRDWVRPYGIDAPWLHFHNYLEIGYCHAGTGELILGEISHTYYPGTFTVIPANFPHNTVSKPGTTSFWEYLFIDARTFLKDTYANNPHKVRMLTEKAESNAYFLNIEEHKQMGNLVLALLDNFRTKEELYKESAKGLLLALVVDVVRLYQKSGVESKEIDADIKIIINALEYVEENFKEQIKISEMAEACHLSETHFRRVFGQCMGISPLTYINLVRVEAACKMMRTTDQSIKEIALNCGFFALPVFNRNFKALIGDTPTRWRKNKRQAEPDVDKSSVIIYNGWL